jgi:hypothetical protein
MKTQQAYGRARHRPAGPAAGGMRHQDPASLPGTQGIARHLSHPTQLPGAILEAQNWLAERLGLAVDQLEVVSFEQVDWTDSCLGLGGPAESCLQAITPGYQRDPEGRRAGV